MKRVAMDSRRNEKDALGNLIDTSDQDQGHNLDRSIF